MPRRFFTRDEARAFYDRFGSKQDWQRSNYVLDLLSPEDIRQVLVEAYRLLKSDGRLCVVSLTHGNTWVSRVVTWVWNQIHRLNPRLVGGCRPLQLSDFLDERQWRIDYHNVVTAFGISSEVMVASKCVGER